jgi:hypothetical protein
VTSGTALVHWPGRRSGVRVVVHHGVCSSVDATGPRRGCNPRRGRFLTRRRGARGGPRMSMKVSMGRARSH